MSGDVRDLPHADDEAGEMWRTAEDGKMHLVHPASLKGQLLTDIYTLE